MDAENRLLQELQKLWSLYSFFGASTQVLVCCEVTKDFRKKILDDLTDESKGLLVGEDAAMTVTLLIPSYWPGAARESCCTARDRANFTGLVLGCIEAKFCKKICVWKLSPRSTQSTPLHRSLISKFSSILHFSKVAIFFCKCWCFFAKSMIFRRKFHGTSIFQHTFSLQHFNFLLLSDPMFPFSYHSFQTDPQAGISRNPK